MIFLVAAACGAALVMAAVLARAAFALVIVRGNSMSPTLRDGERVLVRRSHRIHAGQVVVFAAVRRHRSDPPWLVKRVTEVEGEQFTVAGDNPRSLGSAQLGVIARADLLGVVVRPVSRRVPS
ncbi:S24/S26 family peptidase [Catellatospora methionotrophica]|uniref:S24/S26 family peptidase n=1 Tax=Catellatospora methionotrophica TaxID=121620 RepID=UPI0033FCFEAE